MFGQRYVNSRPASPDIWGVSTTTTYAPTVKSPQTWRTRIIQQSVLQGNRSRVYLRVFSLVYCKQSWRVKIWKIKARLQESTRAVVWGHMLGTETHESYETKLRSQRLRISANSAFQKYLKCAEVREKPGQSGKTKCFQQKKCSLVCCVTRCDCWLIITLFATSRSAIRDSSLSNFGVRLDLWSPQLRVTFSKSCFSFSPFHS